MAFIDGTVVNVALPALQQTFNATALDVQWVVEGYALLLSAFLLVGGSLGDHYGRRRIFLVGIAIFTLASVGCGLATNIRMLIAARALQGFGAALLVPGSLAIISSSFDEQERGRAIGTWSAFSAITTAIGPVFGGWLIEHISWRAAFFINVPIALLSIAISLRAIGAGSTRERTKIDWLGALLAVTGLGMLVYGLIQSSQSGFQDRFVAIALFSAVVVLISFVVVEARSSHPMLPLSLFHSRLFAGTNLLTFLLYAALGGTLFFLPLNLIQVQGYSAVEAGAALLPFILIMSLLSRWSGGVMTRYGARLPLIVGPTLAAIGYALFLLPGIGGSYWTSFFPAIIFLGLGMATTVAPLTTSVMSSVAQAHAGVASGINNAVARSAGLLAVALFGVVMLHVFHHELGRRLRGAHLPTPITQAVDAQSAKLAAIAVPADANSATRDVVGDIIKASFVFAFRVVMTGGVALAIGGALVAILFVRPTPKSRYSA